MVLLEPRQQMEVIPFLVQLLQRVVAKALLAIQQTPQAVAVLAAVATVALLNKPREAERRDKGTTVVMEAQVMRLAGAGAALALLVKRHKQAARLKAATVGLVFSRLFLVPLLITLAAVVAGRKAGTLVVAAGPEGAAMGGKTQMDQVAPRTLVVAVEVLVR